MHCPPPKRFQPVSEVTWATLSDETPQFAQNRKRARGRKRTGIVYEKKGHEFFTEKFGNAYLPGPWIRFNDAGKMRWCQPDALVFSPFESRITILEFKYQHTSDAWWQLTKLYRPVVQRLFPEWQLRICEVVKWYDCDRVFPEPVRLVPDFDRLTASDFGVHIWKP